MKHSLLILTLLTVLFSCTRNDDNRDVRDAGTGTATDTTTTTNPNP